MEKALGFRLMDCVKECTEIEMSKEELLSALYIRKTQEKINLGIEKIENSLKSQASVYGVNYENYANKVQEIKENYLSQINKLKEEYQFQFINLQLELRETLANQKIALVNAKKVSDMKKEFIESDKYKEYINIKNDLETHLNNALRKDEYDKYYNLLANLQNPIDVYNLKKEVAMKKYEDLDSLVKSCETKINYCMNETYSEIEELINKSIESSLLVAKENAITKLINKITNIFSGISKFEGKIKAIENNVESLKSNSVSKIEKIRSNTIELVAEIQIEKDALNSAKVA